MDEISCKGFRARIDFDSEDSLYVWHLIDIGDIIGFHAESREALRAAFEEAVDDYIAICSDKDRQHVRAQLFDGAQTSATSAVDEAYFQELRMLKG